MESSIDKPIHVPFFGAQSIARQALADLEKSKRENDSLRQQLDETRNTSQQTLGELESAKNENDSLRNQLAQLHETPTADLERESEKARKENAEVIAVPDSR